VRQQGVNGLAWGPAPGSTFVAAVQRLQQALKLAMCFNMLSSVHRLVTPSRMWLWRLHSM